MQPDSTVTIYVQPPSTRPVIVATPTNLPAAQDSTGTFSVTLSAAPTLKVTVAVSLAPGNTGLPDGSHSTLTFTSSSWDVVQNVTITADTSSTGLATSTGNATGYTPATETTSSGGNGHATALQHLEYGPCLLPQPYLANARSPSAVDRVAAPKWR